MHCCIGEYTQLCLRFAKRLICDSFWDTDHSQGINSEDYFLAKKYAHSNAIPARTYVPPVEHLDPTDVWAHLDKQKVPTPFISVSDSLVWSLNKILKKKEWKKPKLSIIDGQALPERAVFYALPFYKQFLVRRSMTDGHGRGISAHEYLVWRDMYVHLQTVWHVL